MKKLIVLAVTAMFAYAATAQDAKPVTKTNPKDEQVVPKKDMTPPKQDATATPAPKKRSSVRKGNTVDKKSPYIGKQGEITTKPKK